MQDRRGCHSYGMNPSIRRRVSGSGVSIWNRVSDVCIMSSLYNIY